MRAACVAALLAALSVGCGSYIHDASQIATQAAVDTLASPKSKKELDDLAAEAAGAARDKALDADTTAKLLAIRDAMLDERLHVEIAGLREELLGSRTRQLGLSLIDGSLVTLDARGDSLREHLFGQPLRDDLDALAAEAQAKLPGVVQSSVSPIKVTVDTEANKAEHVAMWAGALVLLAVIVYVVESHRRAIVKMAEAIGGQRP